MKKLLFLFLLSLFCSTTQAQYRKLPLDTKHFWQQQVSINMFPQPYTTCNYRLKVLKDSIVNGKKFKHIIESNAGCNPGYPPYLLTVNKLIREDTVLKIVTVLDNGQEKIIYNFNKNVGDTVTLFGLNQVVATTTVLVKDSILCSDGFYHKRFMFANSSITHIEGIGSTDGLIPSLAAFEFNQQLNCLAALEPTFSTIYSIGGLGTYCSLTVGLQNQTNLKNSIAVFPNPSTNVLNIRIENEIPESIELKNILGQTVFVTNAIKGNLTTINTNDLPQGMYFININLAGQNITERFIKN
jgi:hypothetical protein